VTLFATAFIYI